jgi:hypothetical protein
MDQEKQTNVGFVTGKNLETARLNSKLGVITSVICSSVTLVAIIGSALVSRTRNHVAAVPIGQLWEFPMVHWVNSPSRYEEDAKPLHVAQKYIRGLYEVDPIDFSQVKFENETVLLSNRIAELLNYTLPGSQENLKVSMALERSQTLFKLFSECKCLKRFLITDFMISQPPLPTLRIEVIGRFVIFGKDGRRPLPADDLGYKSIVLWMANDIPVFDRQNESEKASEPAPKVTAKKMEVDQGSDKDEGKEISSSKIRSLPKAVNPEGWFVVKSQIRTLSLQDVEDIRQIRLDSGMKGIF